MKHSLNARIRLFHIWQVLGENPWKKQRTSKKEGKDFYKGAFDTLQKYINTAEEKDRAGAEHASS